MVLACAKEAHIHGRRRRARQRKRKRESRAGQAAWEQQETEWPYAMGPAYAHGPWQGRSAARETTDRRQTDDRDSGPGEAWRGPRLIRRWRWEREREREREKEREREREEGGAIDWGGRGDHSPRNRLDPRIRVNGHIAPHPHHHHHTNRLGRLW